MGMFYVSRYPSNCASFQRIDMYTHPSIYLHVLEGPLPPAATVPELCRGFICLWVFVLWGYCVCATCLVDVALLR